MMENSKKVKIDGDEACLEVLRGFPSLNPYK
jgi:hypothetical protein